MSINIQKTLIGIGAMVIGTLMLMYFFSLPCDVKSTTQDTKDTKTGEIIAHSEVKNDWRIDRFMCSIDSTLNSVLTIGGSIAFATGISLFLGGLSSGKEGRGKK